MLKKILITGILMLAVVVGAGLQQGSAQESNAVNAAPESLMGHAYKVDFLMSEMEDGKKLNTRQYSLNLNAGDQDELKIGTRVPVEVKQGEIQYLDVGTNVWCRLRDRKDVTWLGDNVLLNVRSELSNFAIPDQMGQSTRPAIRQMKIESSTIAVVGKSMVVGMVDDPNSKRQFQLEVTVTKLR
jgi:hypothetical protein